MFTVHTNSQRFRRDHVQKVFPQGDWQVNGIGVLPIVRVRLLPALVNAKVEPRIVDSIEFESEGGCLVLADWELFKSFDFEWRTSPFHFRIDGIHNLKLNLKFDILQWGN